MFIGTFCCWRLFRCASETSVAFYFSGTHAVSAFAVTYLAGARHCHFALIAVRFAFFHHGIARRAFHFHNYFSLN